MASKISAVKQFYQRKILSSGYLFDDDMDLIKDVRTISTVVIPRRISLTRYIIGGAAVGLLCVAQRGRRSSKYVACVAGLPIFYKVYCRCIEFYASRKENQLQNNLLELFASFKCLDYALNDVFGFLKTFEKVLRSMDDCCKQLPAESILEMSKAVYNIEVDIVNMIIKIIMELQPGAKDYFLLDFSDFEAAMSSFNIDHSQLQDCLFNAKYVDGQMVMVRSHFLVIMYYVCCSTESDDILLEIMGKRIPALTLKVNDSVEQIKMKLDPIRFPPDVPKLNLVHFEDVVFRRRSAVVPRMKRAIIGMNNGISATVLNLKGVLAALDNVKSAEDMVLLENSVRSLSKELYHCYDTSRDFVKLLEIMNSKNNEEEKQTNKVEPSFEPTEATAGPSSSEGNQLAEEQIESENAVYQLFASPAEGGELSGSDDETAYVERICVAPYLLEMKQSDAFKLRVEQFRSQKITTPPSEMESLIESLQGKADQASKAEEVQSLKDISESAAGTSSSHVLPPCLPSLKINHPGYNVQSLQKMTTPPIVKMESLIGSSQGKKDISERAAGTSSSHVLPPCPPPLPINHPGDNHQSVQKITTPPIVSMESLMRSPQRKKDLSSKAKKIQPLKDISVNAAGTSPSHVVPPCPPALPINHPGDNHQSVQKITTPPIVAMESLMRSSQRKKQSSVAPPPSMASTELPMEETPLQRSIKNALARVGVSEEQTFE